MALRPLRRLLRPGPRLVGEPRSANGASSFHLRWGGLPPRLTAVEAVLEVIEAPTVDRLYFWALQGGFHDGHVARGAAHLGLQWYARHPGGTAVNWGGYRSPAEGSGELTGTTSSLPSATGNVNTRDFAWLPGRPYRFRIRRGERGWRGEIEDTVDGTVAVVRELLAPGPWLTDPVVWSEVFARCDHPSVVVRWSGFLAAGPDGEWLAPDRLVVSYQRHADGGCDNTTVRPDGDGVLQITATERDLPHGAVLPR